jgi:hypothetical protein
LIKDLTFLGSRVEARVAIGGGEVTAWLPDETAERGAQVAVIMPKDSIRWLSE